MVGGDSQPDLSTQVAEAGPALDEAATAIGESWASSIEGDEDDI